MKKLLALTAVMLFAASLSFGQTTFAPTGDATLNLTVGTEALIQVDASDSFTTSTGSFQDYTAVTHYTYKIRTSKTSGTGKITVAFATDWAGTGGPSIVAPPTPGDYLSFASTAVAPATAASGSQNIIALATDYTVATFGANATSVIGGNTGNLVNWTLVNDPKYAVDSYSVTATFTISAT